MASIGLKLFKFSPIDENGNYTGVSVIGKAIDCKPKVNIAEAKLHADDAVAESIKIPTGGTIDLTTDDVDLATYSKLIGHEYVLADKEMVRNVNDIAPYVGLGYIITAIKNNVLKYEVNIYKKIQFKESLKEGQTKGDSIEFKTQPLSGDIIIPDDGNWAVVKEFENEAEAIKYLDEYFKPIVDASQPE